MGGLRGKDWCSIYQSGSGQCTLSLPLMHGLMPKPLLFTVISQFLEQQLSTTVYMLCFIL